MRWSHLKMQEWKALEKRKSEGKATKPIDERPEITTGELLIWEYFWALRHFTAAPAMGGVNPISATQIDAWLKHFNPVFLTSDDKFHILNTIVALDKEYMMSVGKKQEKNSKQKKAEGKNGRHIRRTRR